MVPLPVHLRVMAVAGADGHRHFCAVPAGHYCMCADACCGPAAIAVAAGDAAAAVVLAADPAADPAVAAVVDPAEVGYAGAVFDPVEAAVVGLECGPAAVAA